MHVILCSMVLLLYCLTSQGFNNVGVYVHFILHIHIRTYVRMCMYVHTWQLQNAVVSYTDPYSCFTCLICTVLSNVAGLQCVDKFILSFRTRKRNHQRNSFEFGRQATCLPHVFRREAALLRVKAVDIQQQQLLQ